ncbi:MAG: hypothetical protein RRA15_03085 [bacterium]|nr:hypothetical protein [bacterium]MDT8365459.1 hypothetical protein [bacterium]
MADWRQAAERRSHTDTEKICILGPGDMVVVPPDEPHTVQPLTPRLRLVDSFTPLRTEFL